MGRSEEEKTLNSKSMLASVTCEKIKQSIKTDKNFDRGGLVCRWWVLLYLPINLTLSN